MAEMPGVRFLPVEEKNPSNFPMTIRRVAKRDWAAVWKILEPVFRAGESYVYSPDISEADARSQWVEIPKRCFVATDGEGEILGTYYLKENQQGLGNHFCTCGYVVAEDARGQGVASAMCWHSQQEARKHRFVAMQYNLVATSNVGAIRLWEQHGFEVVGRLPGAFRHARLGNVDTLIMYKELKPLIDLIDDMFL